MVSFTTSYTTLKRIFTKNPLSLDFSPKNRLTKSNLTIMALVENGRT